MKARVKATGEIVEITSGVICIDKNGNKLTIHSDFIEPYIDNNTDNDYWEKLKHQYAGMFFKSFLDEYDNTVSIEKLMDTSIKLSKMFINKLKENSQFKK